MENLSRKRLGYQRLNVWKEAMAYAENIARELRSPCWQRDRALRDQLRRASASIPSNIAEGEEQSTNKASLNFYHVAKGSLSESRTQVALAKAHGLIDQKTFDLLDEKAETVARLIGGVLRMRKAREEQNSR